MYTYVHENSNDDIFNGQLENDRQVQRKEERNLVQLNLFGPMRLKYIHG